MGYSILDRHYQLSQTQVNFFKKNGFIKLKNVLNKETLDYYNQVISVKVDELSQQVSPLKDRDTYGKAFLQLFNLWRKDLKIKTLVFSKRIARLATDLMEVDGVRMYHDQALFKEVGGGITPWHADQYYWPLSSSKTITAWIPLQKTPLKMGPLEFSAGSQEVLIGRGLSISDKSEQVIQKNLRVNDFPHIIEAFDLGEISFHSGWVFHRAGSNKTDEMRKVMTIIYIDKDITLSQPENKGQQNDWETWCPGVKIGSIVNSTINPILFKY